MNARSHSEHNIKFFISHLLFLLVCLECICKIWTRMHSEWNTFVYGMLYVCSMVSAYLKHMKFIFL